MRLIRLDIGYYAVYNMQDKIASVSHEKLRSDLTVAKTYFNNQVPGYWEVKEGKLFKGNILINDISIIDDIKNMTIDSITIFLDDVRIATTVIKPDGTRAIWYVTRCAKKYTIVRFSDTEMLMITT